MKEQFFKCSCSSEILRVSHDEELDLTEFSIWEMQNSHKATFWQRMRWCWRILTEGSPYGDQVVLEKEGVANLVDYLVKIQNNE
jgi:hypothetical protein